MGVRLSLARTGSWGFVRNFPSAPITLYHYYYFIFKNCSCRFDISFLWHILFKRIIHGMSTSKHSFNYKYCMYM